MTPDAGKDGQNRASGAENDCLIGKDALLCEADGNHTHGLIVDVKEAYFGRGANLRRRIHRERPSAFQATGSAGGHYQGGEEALLLFEARRKEAPQE
jgi:hypothetical protein